ncbi:MAG: hypothetical protein AAGG01_19705, partial [Planctomycetota bacterium]
MVRNGASTGVRAGGFAAALLLAAWASQEKPDVYRTDGEAQVVPVEACEGPFDAEAPQAAVNARVRATLDGDLLEVADDAGSWSTLRGPADCIAGVQVASSSSGLRMLVWDEYSGGPPEAGGSFDVVAAFAEKGEGFGEPVLIAGGPRFQARPSVAATVHDGAFYVAWEEGSDGWGAEFRSVDRQWTNATDLRGPLHSWRAVRLARVENAATLTEIEVPMPSFALQAANPKRRPGAEKIGVFYER